MNNFKQRRIPDPAIETRLEKAIQKVESSVLHDIKHTALRGDSDITPILNEMMAEMESIKINLVKKELQIDLEKSNAWIERDGFNKFKEENQNKKSEITRELSSLLRDKNFDPDYNPNVRTYAIAAIIVLVGLDAVLNYQSFTVVTANNGIAIFTAIVTLGALGASAHFIGRKYRELREKGEKQKRILFMIISLAAASLLFYGLALLRGAFYGEDGSWIANPYLWAVWNSFFFGVAVYISAEFLPTKNQWKEVQKYRKLKAKHKKLSKEKERLKKEFETREDKYNQVLLAAKAVHDYMNDLFEFIENEKIRIEAGAIKEFHLRGGTTSFLTK